MTCNRVLLVLTVLLVLVLLSLVPDSCQLPVTMNGADLLEWSAVRP